MECQGERTHYRYSEALRVQSRYSVEAVGSTISNVRNSSESIIIVTEVPRDILCKGEHETYRLHHQHIGTQTGHHFLLVEMLTDFNR
jgi:hypothetical protein